VDHFSPLPPKEKPSVVALALSVFVHVALIGALFLGVQWRSQVPSSVAVEVWRGVPAPVAVSQPKPPPRLPEPEPEPPPPPPPPEPPPPPPPPEPVAEPPPPVAPDIEIKDEQKKEAERLEKERLERERLEKERLEKARLERERLEKERLEKEHLERERLEKERLEKERLEKARLEKERLEKERLERERREKLQKEAELEAQRQRTMRDFVAGAEAEISQMKADQAARARARGQANWVARIQGKIRGNTVLPPSIKGNPQVNFKVKLLPSGEIISVTIAKSSGDKAWDEASERAIWKSSPLPLPDDQGVFQPDLDLIQKPFDE
jgi:colicin import membrane protein